MGTNTESENNTESGLKNTDIENPNIKKTMEQLVDVIIERSAMPGEKKTILVVDDDIIALTAIRKILENTFDVCLAKSASVAWNILNNTMIDLILLDVEMPAMSGLEFLDYLKVNNAFQYIPVIIVTAHARQDIIIKSKKSGAKGFMVKPVSADTLIEKVKSVLTEAGPETEQDKMFKNLHFLDIACKTGKSVEAERLIGILAQKRYNHDTDAMLDIIYQEIKSLNYPAAIASISELIKNNLYEKKK